MNMYTGGKRLLSVVHVVFQFEAHLWNPSTMEVTLYAVDRKAKRQEVLRHSCYEARSKPPPHLIKRKQHNC
jgi:hypothetical protein